MSTTGDSLKPSSHGTERGNECAAWQALFDGIPYARHLELEVTQPRDGLC